jgi:hypothetical protein
MAGQKIKMEVDCRKFDFKKVEMDVNENGHK